MGTPHQDVVRRVQRLCGATTGVLRPGVPGRAVAVGRPDTPRVPYDGQRPDVPANRWPAADGGRKHHGHASAIRRTASGADAPEPARRPDLIASGRRRPARADGLAHGSTRTHADGPPCLPGAVASGIHPVRPDVAALAARSS